jgi:hypothetical protein
MNSKKYREEAVNLYLDGAQLVSAGQLLAGLLVAADGKYAEKKALALENELKGVTHIKIDNSLPDCPFITEGIYEVNDVFLSFYVRGRLTYTTL